MSTEKGTMENNCEHLHGKKMRVVPEVTSLKAVTIWMKNWGLYIYAAYEVSR